MPTEENIRTKDLEVTATEADINAGNYLVLDGIGGTKKAPINMVCVYRGTFQSSGAASFAELYKFGHYSYYGTDVTGGIDDAPVDLKAVPGIVANYVISPNVSLQVVFNGDTQVYYRRIRNDKVEAMTDWVRMGKDCEDYADNVASEIYSSITKHVRLIDRYGYESSIVEMDLRQGYIGSDGSDGPVLATRVCNQSYISVENQNMELRCYGDVAIRTINRYNYSDQSHNSQMVSGGIRDRWVLCRGWKYKVTFCRKSDPSLAISVDEVEENSYLSIAMADLAQSPENVFAKYIHSKKAFKVKIVGDSIAQGVNGTGFAQNGDFIITINGQSWYRNPNGYCWANELKKILEAKYNCTVDNMACRGTGSHHLLDNWNTFIKSEDDVIICCYGTNDRSYTATKDLFLQHILDIKNRAAEQGKDIIFVSGIPAGNQNELCKTNNYQQIYWHMEDSDQVISEATCGQYISLYTRVMDWLECSDSDLLDYLDSNQLHPNDALYRKMFVWVAESLGVPAKIVDATWVDGEVYRP